VNLTKQDDIYKFQSLMQAGDTVELNVQHHFSDGLYARELFIPAGVCLVGALHKTRHMYMVVSGKCRVSSQYGNQEIVAPFMGETLPGTKRVIYAETDCVWVGFHPTDLTDIDQIAAEILEPEVV
tara:strand:- start:2564 stop:2938 length:375 start_codon:yes stop_codon:yes gene_type:complete